MSQREPLALPSHIGIIMDGNGRWAQARGLPRTEGHREGLETAKRIVKAARELGIKVVSLYTFSTENWKRASDEVGFLMGLIKRHLAAELDFYRANGVKIVHSGDPEGLSPEVLGEIRRAERDTAEFSSIVVNLAINYGGRDEILRAFRRCLQAGKPEGLEEGSFASFLDHPELPDPDLIIRTAGEQRLSNFLTWESAYSEYWFSPKFWPDFTGEDLAGAVSDYCGRERRFGGLR